MYQNFFNQYLDEKKEEKQLNDNKKIRNLEKEFQKKTKENDKYIEKKL